MSQFRTTKSHLGLKWQQLWAIECVRLYEQQHGVGFAEEKTRTIAHNPSITSIEAKLAVRAAQAASDYGLDVAMQALLKRRGLLVFIWLCVGFLIGLSMVSPLLQGDYTQVNFGMLIGVLVLPNLLLLSLTLVLPLIASGRKSAADRVPPMIAAHAGMELAQWLMQWGKEDKQQRAMAFTALVNVVRQQGALAWLAAAASHLIWLAIMLGVSLSLFIHFNLTEYVFHWRSTLLSSAHIQVLASMIAAPLTWFGVHLPEQAFAQNAGWTTHRALGIWLLAAVFLYGLVLRFLALLFTFWRTKRRLARPALNLSLPGICDLLAQLQPTRSAVIDPELAVLEKAPEAARQDLEEKPAIANKAPAQQCQWTLLLEDPGLEVFVRGNADNSSAMALLTETADVERLPRNTTGYRVLINVNLTPDRGNIDILELLTARAQTQGIPVNIYLCESRQSPDQNFRAEWQTRLQQLDGLEAIQVRALHDGDQL